MASRASCAFSTSSGFRPQWRLMATAVSLPAAMALITVSRAGGHIASGEDSSTLVRLPSRALILPRSVSTS